MPLYKLAGFFNAHESHRAQSLAGVPLAPFWRRFFAVSIDFFILALTNAPVKAASNTSSSRSFTSAKTSTTPPADTRGSKSSSAWK